MRLLIATPGLESCNAKVLNHYHTITLDKLHKDKSKDTGNRSHKKSNDALTIVEIGKLMSVSWRRIQFIHQGCVSRARR
eukprot:scaffold710_cov186-Alexandrium_tamarense.AAC.3